MDKVKKNKPILFTVLTHGDEEIGLRVINRLDAFREIFDWEIANLEAYKKNLDL